MKISKKLKITFSVFIILFGAGCFWIQFGHPIMGAYILWSEKRLIASIGEECKKKAAPIGGGHVLATCSYDYLDSGLRRILYDTSGQAGLPPWQRTDEWRCEFMYRDKEASVSETNVRWIEGDFYEVYTDWAGPHDKNIVALVDGVKCRAFFEKRVIDNPLARTIKW